GSQSGNRFPSVVGANNRVYQSAGLYYRDYIDAGGILGWTPGSSVIDTPESYTFVVDEPVYYAAGGNIIYWSLHDDLGAGAFDTSVANTYGSINKTREWNYWDQGLHANDNLLKLFPNYDLGSRPWYFGGPDGSYGRNGDGNPPIPYNGMVYLHRGNSLLAFGTTAATAGAEKTPARIVPTAAAAVTVDTNALKAKLNAEVQKMISAGHLLPGYFSSGHIDGDVYQVCGDAFTDYFHNPADTLWVLSAAMPYLTPALAQSTKTYLQNEYTNYNPTSVTHVGWQTGASRDWFDLPPDVNADRVNYPPTQWISYDFIGWGQRFGGTNIPSYAFYAMWKYAQ
ncbi:MAG TPA: hypothetical protein VJ508_01275, partial [Saprospiraceae bacterium]|nr:hypothetical protein [Saprospiraceae bacterium]